MRLVVHGGAGSAPREPAPRQTVLDEAAATGAAETDPLDAVEAACRVLESSPRFNAGVGGAVQSDGVVRTDAGVMTDDREVGAAAGMPGVEHAVSVARAVRDRTPHVLLAGDPAVALADAVGVETDVDLLTDRSRERWADADPPATDDPLAHLDWLRDRFGSTAAGGRGEADDSPAGGPTTGGDPTDHDTVGAVARQGDAFAAATSTGGRWFALAGRVGDVPQVGSGFYCAPAGGASATGAGEDIARVTLSRRAVDHLEAGRDAGTAASLAVEEFAELTGSEAGVVVLGRDSVGSAFNTEAMQTATAGEDE
jgi:beta-aspartyl-peptidase (threonine type)